jgi:hypothetical protein
MIYQIKSTAKIEDYRLQVEKDAACSLESLTKSNNTFYRSNYESYIVNKAQAAMLKALLPEHNVQGFKDTRENSTKLELTDNDIILHRIAYYSRELTKSLEYSRDIEDYLAIKGKVQALLWVTDYYDFGKLVIDYAQMELSARKEALVEK